MKEVIPLLRVKDLEETIAFYCDQLGFELCRHESDTAFLKHGQVSMMFSTGDNLGAEPQLSGTLYFYPEDVAALWLQVHQRVEVEWPLQDMDYGTREFGIRDCNGYILAFAEVT